jgi:uncharacterized PurR-regulated membrane protein YhhQ (DUF165 family)
VTIINAFVFIGLDLTARDRLHEQWQGQLKRNMGLLILAGSAISYLLNASAGQIAVASCVAFGAAALADTAIYQALGNRERMVRVNGSNVVSAAVDSFVFPVLAFGWPPLWGIVLGQFAAKVCGGFIWSLILEYPRRLVMRYELNQTPHS